MLATLHCLLLAELATGQLKASRLRLVWQHLVSCTVLTQILLVVLQVASMASLLMTKTKKKWSKRTLERALHTELSNLIRAAQRYKVGRPATVACIRLLLRISTNRMDLDHSISCQVWHGLWLNSFSSMTRFRIGTVKRSLLLFAHCSSMAHRRKWFFFWKEKKKQN